MYYIHTTYVIYRYTYIYIVYITKKCMFSSPFTSSRTFYIEQLTLSTHRTKNLIAYFKSAHRIVILKTNT